MVNAPGSVSWSKVLSMTLKALLKQVHSEILNVSMGDLRSLFILAIIENLTETLGNFSVFFVNLYFLSLLLFVFLMVFLYWIP